MATAVLIVLAIVVVTAAALARPPCASCASTSARWCSGSDA